MDIAIATNQQAHRCTQMCHRDLDLAEKEPERAEKLVARAAERLPCAFPEAELGLRAALHPDPALCREMLKSDKWLHRIKRGLLGNDPRIAALPIARLQDLDRAGMPLDKIFNALLARAEEQDDPQVFHLALSSVEFDKITRHSMVPRWIERCTPSRAAVMADFLRTIGDLAPRSLEKVFSFWPLTGDQQFLSPKLVLAAEFFYDKASGHLVHEGEGTGGLGMAVVRALRSNHGKMSLLGRWPTLEDRLGLTRAQIEEACPPG